MPQKMIDYSDQGVVWYAMKTTYKKEMQAKEYLDSRGVECFVPMRQDITNKHGHKCVIRKPAIHNLIFVKADIEQIKDIKISLNYLHNRLMTEDSITKPIIVPTKQMEQFIAAMTLALDEIKFVDLSMVQLDKGTPVRIIEGQYSGYEGFLEKIKGKRDRRVNLIVGDIIAYKIDVPVNFIEKI